MELYHEAIDHEESLVHEWRVTQLRRLGIPGPLAEAEADNVDWHQIARLIQRGCSPRLALRIVRLQLPRKVSREVASGSYRCRSPCDLGSMVGGEDDPVVITSSDTSSPRMSAAQPHTQPADAEGHGDDRVGDGHYRPDWRQEGAMLEGVLVEQEADRDDGSLAHRVLIGEQL